MAAPQFDVFLSYSEADQAVVLALADVLRTQSGLQLFLDRWHLIPGRPWQEEHDCLLNDLPATALSGAELTHWLHRIQAGRLLVLLDCCHSGGIGDPKRASDSFQQGWSDDAYALLAQGRGRALIASSRPDEVSWVLRDMDNSLFTHYLLQALRGEGRTLGDGYVRVFDLFRHVAEEVPKHAGQHPIFKVAEMETDFPVALSRT